MLHASLALSLASALLHVSLCIRSGRDMSRVELTSIAYASDSGYSTESDNRNSNLEMRKDSKHRNAR